MGRLQGRPRPVRRDGDQLKVLLYNPRSNGSGKRVMPFSLLALGAALEGRHEYAIVDGGAEAAPLAALRERLGRGDALLGVTVMPGRQLAAALQHSRALKAELPGLQVAWGGYFPTEHPEACLRSGVVDYVVRGHGEAAFVALVDAVSDGAAGRARVLRDPAPEGLAFRDEAGELRIGPVARLPAPDELPPFPFHRLDVASYVRRTFLGERTLGYHSSYGCPFLCNFCGVVSLARGRWLAQSPARVEDALRRYVSEWRVDAVEFYDNNFFTHEARAAEIAARLRPLGLAWWGEGRVDTLLRYDEGTLRLLRDSGLRMVFLGAESGSADTLERMDKGGTLTPEMTLELAARLRGLGIVPELSFVLGSPPDPEGDTERTLAFVRRVKQAHPEAEIILYNYTPVPVKGALLDAAEQGGFAFPDSLDEWAGEEWQGVARRRAALPWMSERLRRRIRDFERVLNAYYPTSTDPRLRGWRRGLLRAASGWRWRLGIYAHPLELRALQRLLRYQRPETSGF